MRRLLTGLLIGTLLGGGLAFVGSRVRRHLAEEGHLRIVMDTTARLVTIEPHHLRTDVSRLVEINDAGDLLRKRAALCLVLFGEVGLPALLPEPLAGPDLARRHLPLAGHLRTEVLIVRQEHGVDSILLHHLPARPRGRLALYHAGHENDLGRTRRTVSALLQAGYEVLALAMPLLEQNPRPIVAVPRFGELRLFHHDHLQFVKVTGHPVKLFVQPVVAAVNYAARRGFPGVAMIGLSGGGWTTTLAAAIDERIRRSYPVAGSLPFYLRYDKVGDYEESALEVYTVANYLEQYLLGAAGVGRGQVQVLNRWDPCCNAAGRHVLYEPLLSARARALSGSFSVHVDETLVSHIVSPAAMAMVLRDLDGAPGLDRQDQGGTPGRTNNLVDPPPALP